jgi:hypothetical protein
MPAATPQDHKTKAEPFKFTVKGKSYTLPPIGEDAATSIPGGVTQDAVMYPDDATVQMRLAYFMLDATKPKPDALAALRSLPTSEMLEVMGNWMGESSGSSD